MLNNHPAVNSGQVVAGTLTIYAAFGDYLTQPTTNLTNMDYTRHKHNNLGTDAGNLGLIYMNAMYYMPSLARFLTRHSRENGNTANDRGFSGHKHNDELGLIYMNARY